VLVKDDRIEEVKKLFPLRTIRLDLCECEHDDSDHQTERTLTGVEDGACCICVCKKFVPQITKDRK